MSSNVPRHIAIIMDGNGRWAKARGKSRAEGYAAGAAILEGVVEACQKRGVGYLTVYAFSSENWGRPGAEVKALLNLLGEYLVSKRDNMVKKDVKFNVIGDVDSLPENLVKRLEETKLATKDCKSIVFTVAISYGARQEMVRAFKGILADGLDEVGVDDIDSYLDTAGMPDPDLLIRTGGEKRLSNFLLWQMAYSELHFTSVYWPDFNEASLDEAIAEFASRDRRYGLTAEKGTK